MSAHFSKFSLNTYLGTPYFQAHLPEGYPISAILMKSKAFRWLPPDLHQLAILSKQWDKKNGRGGGVIGQYYDEDGNELNPDTGAKLTDMEIEAQWLPDPALASVPFTDIPVPAGGFPDPLTWTPPPIEVTPDKDEPPSEEQLRSDIASHGYERVSKEYGIPIENLPKGVKPVEPAPVAEGDGDGEIVGIATGENYTGPPLDGGE